MTCWIQQQCIVGSRSYVIAASLPFPVVTIGYYRVIIKHETICVTDQILTVGYIVLAYQLDLCLAHKNIVDISETGKKKRLLCDLS